MKHARTKDICHQEEHSDPGVQRIVDNSEHLCLADGAGKCQGISDKVEFANLSSVSIDNAICSF